MIDSKPASWWLTVPRCAIWRDRDGRDAEAHQHDVQVDVGVAAGVGHTRWPHVVEEPRPHSSYTMNSAPRSQLGEWTEALHDVRHERLGEPHLAEGVVVADTARRPPPSRNGGSTNVMLGRFPAGIRVLVGSPCLVQPAPRAPHTAENGRSELQ